MPTDKTRHRVRHNLIETSRGIHEREDKAEDEKPSSNHWLDRFDRHFGIRGHISEMRDADDCSCFQVSIVVVEFLRALDVYRRLAWKAALHYPIAFIEETNPPHRIFGIDWAV